jgi:shikimate dehydrogenase
VISGATRVTGIIGWPVAHSLSPAMHNAAFAALGLDWTYVAFPVDPAAVGPAVRGLAAAGVAGLNVTIPHKQAVLEQCSSVSAAAAAIGAANTLIPDGAGGWRADNTDAPGFLRALDEAAPVALEGRTALVIGAGGAARAVVFALRQRGAKIAVANRTPARAAALGEPVGFTRAALEQAAARSQVVVNCTSLGLHGDRIPDELPLDALGPEQVVVDVVYRPGGTAWLAAAAARGPRCVDGLGMLLHQGAAAFVQWTGQDPPIEVMRAALMQSGR